MELLAEPVDAAITSAAGHPLDLTFYQAIKGVTAVQHIVKPGGRILVLGQCSEGVGSPEFAALVRRYKGAQAFLDEIRDTPVAVDQWQLEKLALVALKHPVLFYLPGIRREEMRWERWDSRASATWTMRSVLCSRIFRQGRASQSFQRALIPMPEFNRRCEAECRKMLRGRG